MRPPPDAAPARRVITAGPQPRPGLKGHSTAQQLTSLPASLLFGLPWGYAAPSGPRSNEALLLTKQQPLHTQRDGGSGPSLLQLDYFKVSPHPRLPLTLPYSALSALQLDGSLLCPLYHLRAFNGSLRPSGYRLGFFTQPTRPVQSGCDLTALDTSTGP